MTRARDLANIADGTFTATDLDLSGTLTVSGDAAFDTNTLFVDVSANNVGIGTTSPSAGAIGGKVLHVQNSGGTASVRVDRSDAATAGTLSLTSGNTTNSLYSTGSKSLDFYTNSALAMTLDSSGNLGVGTASPNGTLTVRNDGTNTEQLILGNSLNTGGRDWRLGRDNVATGDFIIAYSDATNNNNTTEAMRIASDGTVLVGKSASNFDTVGIELLQGGEIQATRSGVPMYLRRNSSDGEVLVFYKDTSTVGSIGTGSGAIYIGSSSQNSGISFYGTALYPNNGGSISATDATNDLGAATARWKDVYRSGSTISTSDRNAKQDERPLTEAEASVAQACKELLKAFRFIDAVEKDGAGARIHFGIIAQDLQAAFEAEGLDANSYAMFRPSTFTDDEGNEQTRLGVCYENLLAFIIAAL